MNRLRQFAGQTIIYGLGHILSRIFYFLLITVYLTYRLRDEYQYGIYTDLYAYVSVLVILFSLRMDTAYFRFGSKTENQQSAFGSAVLPVFISAIILVIIGFSLDNQIARWLLYPDSPHYVRWFSLILAFDVLALIPFAQLRISNKARLFVLCKLFNVIFTILLVLLFLEVLPVNSFGEGYLSFIPQLSLEIDYVFLANLIASISVFILLLFLMKKFPLKPDKILVKKMLYYSFPLIIVGVCGSFNQFFAVPLQKYFLGEDVISNISEGGVYGASQKIASIFLLFTTAFNYAAEPFFFNNATESDRQELYGRICRLFVMVGGVLVLMITLGLDIFKYLVADDLRDAIHVIPILLMAYIFLGIYYNISIWYKLADKTWYGAMISICGVIVTAVISIIYLPIIGYIASAWAALITFFLMVVLAYFIGKKIFPIDYPVGKIVTNLILILLIIDASYSFRSTLSSGWTYLINGLLFAIYLIYAWVEEKEEWLSILNKNKSTGNP